MSQHYGEKILSRKYKLIFDSNNKAIYGISNKDICDLKGNKIAFFACDESNRKQKVFNSEIGKFVLLGNTLYLNEIKVGSFKNGTSKASVFLLLVAAILLSITFSIILFIDTPNNDATVINMVDKEGEVKVTKTIAVFDNEIMPGSKGEYNFVLKNPHSYSLRYQFDITEFYNNEDIADFPLVYKIKMNNMYIVNEYIPYDTWVSGEALKFANLDIAASSTQRFTLEWYWPFESGNDTLDTYFGQNNGKYYLSVRLEAELLKEQYYE